MKKANFSLENIVYDRVVIESTNLPMDSIDINFLPSGIFNSKKQTFDLKLVFTAYDEKSGIENSFISLTLTSTFQFVNVSNKEQIPEYFYDNSIAMVFPYIRAFVTSIVFQANLKRKIILPTMNLVGIGQSLELNTEFN